MIVTSTPRPVRRFVADNPANPAPITSTFNLGTDVVSSASLRHHRASGFGYVLDLGKYRLLQSWLVCHRCVGGAYAHDRRVERPEAVLRRPRCDLGSETRRERVLVH